MLEILTSTDVKMPDNPAYIFPFECDTFQLHSFNSINEGKHILVSAPTSSGKTCCAEYAIHNTLRNNKRIIYTSPIKSLSNEKYKEFRDKNICSVGLLTGDNKINPDANLIIATAEILRNALFKNTNDTINTNDTNNTNNINENDILNNVSCVIMDEVHFINDMDRGKVWEETLILLDDSIQLVLLSATIDRVTEFANWIQSIKKNTVSLITTNRRIIPLEHKVFLSNEINKDDIGELYSVLDNSDTFYENIYYECKKKYEKIKKEEKDNNKFVNDTQQINKLIKYLIKNDLLQTIFFSFSRNKCEDYANSVSQTLITPEEQAEAMNIFDYNIAPYRKTYESLPQFITMKQLIQKGVAFHHSGLIPILKEIIEIIFKKGLIKILFATETFAVGVNMPTRTVVFTNLSKNTNRGRRFLNTAEYKQMSGRAGRRGIDTKGTVILMTMYEFPELLDLKSVMIKSMPHITSKFTIDYAYCLKTLNAINTNPESLFKSSLLSSEINKDITYDQERLLDLETKYNTMYNIFNSKYDNTTINNCKLLYEKENTQYLGLNLLIKLTPKQKKENDKLKKLISQEIYNDYLNIKDLEKNVNIYKNNLDNKINYVNIMTEQIYDILINNGFMIFNKSIPHNLSIKGIIAAMVNDCNNILLAELIAQNIFDNLNTKEIISLISIFSNLSKSDNDDEFSHYKSNNLNKEYEDIMNIVLHFNKQEKEHKIYVDAEYWNITNKYIDITMDWVNILYDSPTFMQERAYVLAKLTEMGEYEGNFVKNMLKIYNIICNIKVICNILKKYELLQKLEDADKLILKDIVNVNSLYL